MSGQFIKQKREELGLSQSEFAERSGVNFRTLQDYEQGRKPVSSVKGDVLLKISSTLGCSIEDILFEKDDDEYRNSSFLRRMREYSDRLDRILNKKMGQIIATPFDDVFRTLSVDCSELLIPVINLAFNENYTTEDIVINNQNEHLRVDSDGNSEKVISDSNCVVVNKVGVVKKYQIECQSRTDSSILIRLMEYASEIALEDHELIGDELNLTYPNSAVIFLRHTRNTPDYYKVNLCTPGGVVSWNLPVIKSQLYSVDDIFEKKLYMFIPYFLLTYEKSFPVIESDNEKLCDLRKTYEDILARMQSAQESGDINSYQLVTIKNLCHQICNHLTKKYKNINHEVNDIMGGKILDYEAKDILNRGIQEGIQEGILEGTINSLKNLMSSLNCNMDKAMELLNIPESDKNRLESLM